MDEAIEKAIRALGGKSSGSLRVIAYGVAPSAADEPKTREDLEHLLEDENLSGNALLVIEVGHGYSHAAARPRFKAEILARLEGAPRKKPRSKDGPAPLEGRGAPERARERLAAVTASLPDLLADVDRTLAGRPAAAAPSDSEAIPEVTEPREPTSPTAIKPEEPDANDRQPLVLVKRFEDLGSAAEAIGEALELLVAQGAHVVVHEDGVDTRTREGRSLLRNTIRVGAINAARAREKAVRDLELRRGRLRVYGPVPFGFAREGQDLQPVPEQLETVKRIKELHRLAQTPVTIAATLNREKRPWKDGSRWHWRRVNWILKNPIYDQVLSEAKS